MNTDYSTQTISSDGLRYPQTTGDTDSMKNKKFIDKIRKTILSSDELLKVDISKHQKKNNLKKIKGSMEIIIKSLNSEIDVIEEETIYKIKKSLHDNLTKLNDNLKKLNKMFSSILKV
tara:strand:- start:327 stop:680 length:354 start_codon:yes stop_codon:yes gene_type:complete